MGLVAWTDVPVLASGSAKEKVRSSVFISSNGNGGRFAHWLSLTIRTEEIDLAWLKPGARVNVQIGGEGGRQMRIAHNGPHVLGVLGGKKNVGGAVNLRVPALHAQAPEKVKAGGTAHVVAEGCLVLTLPDWCFARFAKVAGGGAGARADSGPFKMSGPSHKEAVFGSGAGAR